MRRDHDRLRELVTERSWYHTMELAPGIVTPGWFDTRAIVDLVPLPRDLSGRRCLDVGTFDGFWAFEMERRRASEVVALDVPDASEWDWPVVAPEDVREAVSARHEGGRGFDIAHAALESQVRRERVNVYDLDPTDIGTFDVIYLGSLLLHLRDPVGALERVRSICGGMLVLVETIDAGLTRRHPDRAVAAFDGRDRPWWWTPNVAALERMVRSGGFEVTEGPVRLRIPAGQGQGRVALRPATLLTSSGRAALRTNWHGDPHAALVARPRG
ncbi:MAG: class I SAM-dependent methyltransferase [Actinobacteria bacterium]|nr:class I SAM-dependent methyltransferase [Actinomycetota bacterium]